MQDVMRDVEDSSLLEEGLDFASARFRGRRRVRAPISRSTNVPAKGPTSSAVVNRLVNNAKGVVELFQGKRKWPGLWNFTKGYALNRLNQQVELMKWGFNKIGNALAAKVAYPIAGSTLRELDRASFRNDINRILAEEDN